MQANRSLEIGTGLFVLLGFTALGFLTTQLPSSGLKLGGKKSGYHVVAKFDNIGDLKAGSPVSMAGVRIGDVEAIRYDAKEYKAAVTLRIDPTYSEIPDDSDASIQTQGLLGGKYVGIGPGGSDMFLKEGSQIAFTQSAIVLESLVNKFFANFASKGGGDGSSQNVNKDGGGSASSSSSGADASGSNSGSAAGEEKPK